MTSTSDSDAGDLTRDAFLGGRVHLWQPKAGFRSGIDAVLLATAVPARAGDSVLDLGCGAGAAGACLVARVPGALVTGVELQPAYAALARRNGLAEVVESDLTALPAELRQRTFAHVMMNPPYFDRRRSSPAPESGRDVARGGATALADWLETGARRLAPKGTLTVIQRADRLRDLLRDMPEGIGSIAVIPLQPRPGRDASLVLVQGIKGGRAAFRLRAPLVLHEGTAHLSDGDDYSAEATSILRDGAPLSLRA